MKEQGCILITGGAGYIGSYACKVLSKAGYKPVVYDNLVYGHKWAVKWGPLEEGDLSDETRLDQVIKQYQPESVMHFAAYAYVGESMKYPGKYFQNNVSGTLTLLEAMKNHNINKIIFSSSCTIYGIPETIPIQEDHKQCPISPYGASKLMVEEILKYFDLAHGIRSISFRYFNAAGADPDGEIGEDHDPETHLIPLVLDVALRRRPSISIFGTDYETSDGTCIRDYIHIADLVDAHLLGLKQLEQGCATKFYNLGNGQGFSVREIIDTASRVTNTKIPFVSGKRRLGDPPVLVGDGHLAIEELGWKPQYSELETQIVHAWNWHKKHFV